MRKRVRRVVLTNSGDLFFSRRDAPLSFDRETFRIYGKSRSEGWLMKTASIVDALVREKEWDVVLTSDGWIAYSKEI